MLGEVVFPSNGMVGKICSLFALEIVGFSFFMIAYASLIPSYCSQHTVAQKWKITWRMRDLYKVAIGVVKILIILIGKKDDTVS